MRVCVCARARQGTGRRLSVLTAGRRPPLAGAPGTRQTPPAVLAEWDASAGIRDSLRQICAADADAFDIQEAAVTAIGRIGRTAAGLEFLAGPDAASVRDV